MRSHYVAQRSYVLTLHLDNVEAARLRHILAKAGMDPSCKDPQHHELIDHLLGQINTMLDETEEN